jgi:hypothetical protein
MGWAALAAALILFIYPPPWLLKRLRRFDALMDRTQAALTVPGPDGKPLPPLSAVVSVGSSCLVNAAYSLINDPALMEKAKPMLKGMLPDIAYAYGRGTAEAQAVPSNPGRDLINMRWGDRGGKLAKAAAAVPGLGGPAAKIQQLAQYAELAQQLAPLLQMFGGGGNGGQGAAPAAAGGSVAWRPPV